MSEIATLEQLEPFLAHPVINTASASPAIPRTVPAGASTTAMPSGRQGSQLEIFFSEVQYSTFVSKKVKPQAASASGTSGRLKYRLRLH